MPYYDYKTINYDKTVTVWHPIDTNVEIWGQVCFLAQVPLGTIPYDEPVQKCLAPVGILKSTSNYELKEKGFTKLVKRDYGVYENVTATEDESRYMLSDDPSTLPNISKKISD